jgi:hypothetical protein
LCLVVSILSTLIVVFKFILPYISLLFRLQNLHPASIFCRGFSIQEARIIRCGAVPLSSRYRCRYRKSKFLLGHTIWMSVVRWRRRLLVDRVAESCIMYSMLHLTTCFNQSLYSIYACLQKRALHGRTIHPMIPISRIYPSRFQVDLDQANMVRLII